MVTPNVFLRPLISVTLSLCSSCPLNMPQTCAPWEHNSFIELPHSLSYITQFPLCAKKSLVPHTFPLRCSEFSPHRSRQSKCLNKPMNSSLLWASTLRATNNLAVFHIGSQLLSLVYPSKLSLSIELKINIHILEGISLSRMEELLIVGKFAYDFLTVAKRPHLGFKFSTFSPWFWNLIISISLEIK